MHFEIEKCCFFIPLRIGAFFIAIWYFVVYLVETIMGLCHIDAAIVYSGQASWIWYNIDIVLTAALCISGLMGIAGSTICATRRAAMIFGVAVWVNCVMSIIKYVVSLVFMATFQDSIVKSCLRSGIVGFGNAQAPTDVFPKSNPFYTPLHFKNTLNANGHSLDDCTHGVRAVIIGYGIVAFIIQLLQVYFALAVSAYNRRLRTGARHHLLHDKQIKEFEESRYHMTTVY